MVILFGGFLFFLVLGMPVSFCMFVSSTFYLISHDIALVSLVQRVSAGIFSFPLLAGPCFMLAGQIMNTGGVTDRIFTWCNKIVGHIPGGLGHSNILASIVFAGMSGSAVSDAGGLGNVEIKAMRDAGYDDEFSIGITAASSTIGPIIPPSSPAVLVGVIAGISVGRIFVGGIIPGLIMGALLSSMVYYMAVKYKYPRMPRSSLKKIAVATKSAFFSIMCPVITIAGILTGVITPTEAGVIALTYATVLTLAYKEVTVKQIPGIIVQSTRVMLSVTFIIASGAIFGWILAIEQVPQSLAKFFLAYISSKYVFLLVVNIFLLICGCFMEVMVSISLLTPILFPVAINYGIDPVHFALIFILNLMIGLITPPMGVVLFVLSSISNVSFDRIVKGVLPYIISLLIALVVIVAFPSLVTFLPNLVYNRQ
jgi:tripartite ATP-independent transporter DctM subunit